MALTHQAFALFQLLPTSPPHVWMIAADWIQEQGAQADEVTAAAFREGIWLLEPDTNDPSKTADDARCRGDGIGDGWADGQGDGNGAGYADGEGIGRGLGTGYGLGDGEGSVHGKCHAHGWIFPATNSRRSNAGDSLRHG